MVNHTLRFCLRFPLGWASWLFWQLIHKKNLASNYTFFLPASFALSENDNISRSFYSKFLYQNTYIAAITSRSLRYKSSHLNMNPFVSILFILRVASHCSEMYNLQGCAVKPIVELVVGLIVF